MNELPKLPYGMGNYDYLKNGKVRFRKTITEGKKTKRLSVTGDTVQEVNALMLMEEKRFRSNARLGLEREASKTLAMSMEEWLKLYKLGDEGIKAESYDRIESTFLNHIKETNLGRTKDEDVTSDLIQIHMNSLKNKRDGKALSYSSKKKVYELLNAYFSHRFAAEPYLNPMVRVTKPSNPKKSKNDDLIVYNDKEIELLEKVAFEPYIPGKSGFRHGLGIMAILWCFLREGEALALTWNDIDLKKGTIDINKATNRVKIRDEVSGELLEGRKRVLDSPKYDSVRSYKLPQPALDCLKELKNRYPDTLYLFDNGKGEPISEFTLIRSYEQMCIRAELPEQKKVTMHGLRHTGISYYLRHGFPVEVISKMAGHKSIQVTLDTYYSVIQEHKDSATERFNEEYNRLKKEKDNKHLSEHHQGVHGHKGEHHSDHKSHHKSYGRSSHSSDHKNSHRSGHHK